MTQENKTQKNKEAASLEWRRLVAEEADSCINWAAGRAAAIALIPIPFADVVPLIANESYMIHQLAELYGMPADDAVVTMILGCTGGSIAGKFAATLLPFLKIPIAASVTYAVGKVAQAYFETGMKLDESELREMFQKEERKARKREWSPVGDEDASADEGQADEDASADEADA